MRAYLFLSVAFSTILLIAAGSTAHAVNNDAVAVEGSYGPAQSPLKPVEQPLKSAGDAVFPQFTLAPASPQRLQTLAEQESIPKQIGFNRNVAMLETVADTGQQLDWRQTAGQGHYAAIEVTSPGAIALRIGMTIENLPHTAELRFFGIRDHDGKRTNVRLVSGREVNGLLSLNREADPDNPDGSYFWSPTITGDVIGIEIYLPEQEDPASVRIALPLISHITTLPFRSMTADIGVQDEGDANDCHEDATCYPWWGDINRSVALMVFTSSGGTYTCTGNLLNDSDPLTTIPYFTTANHCINDQTAASSLETHWFWQSDTCEGSVRSPFYVSMTGGGTLLHTQGMSSDAPISGSMDITLLQLNQAPPGGAWYAGWSTAELPEDGINLTGIHHPAGDWKKYSTGGLEDHWACGWFSGVSFRCIGNHRSYEDNFIGVKFGIGAVQGGSSGSGVFTDDKKLVGTLTGGRTSCTNDLNFYSSFRAGYIAGNYGQWLNLPAPVSPPPPAQAATTLPPIINLLTK